MFFESTQNVFTTQDPKSKLRGTVRNSVSYLNFLLLLTPFTCAPYSVETMGHLSNTTVAFVEWVHINRKLGQ